MNNRSQNHSWTHARTRQATVDELHALAHPTRQRILRLCLDEPRTNQQIAENMGIQPATALRHVRVLVAQGFLKADEIRTGKRGALERPYRATRLSRRLVLDGSDPELVRRKDIAALRAHIAELLEAPAGSPRGIARGTLRLSPASLAELQTRIAEVLGELAARDEPDGEPVAFIWSLAGRPAPGRDGKRR